MSCATDEWRVWLDAAQRHEIDRALRGLYADLDAAVAERGPVCNASGRCCKFDSFGHRLYVTGLEIAWFLSGVRVSGSGVWAQPDSTRVDSGVHERALPLRQLKPNPKPQAPAPISDACRYQIDGLCSTHAIRPLGCRVYFCEAGTGAWQQDTYERFMQQLKTIHNTHGLPYTYMEWRAGLIEADTVLDQRG